MEPISSPVRFAAFRFNEVAGYLSRRGRRGLCHLSFDRMRLGHILLIAPTHKIARHLRRWPAAIKAATLRVEGTKLSSCVLERGRSANRRRSCVMANPSQFSTDRTYPGWWTVTFNKPPINMFVPKR